MTYGPLTVDDWQDAHRQGVYLHVYLDGVEVTTECEYANDDAGIVVVLLRNAEGKRYLDPESDAAAREEKHGHVEIVAELIACPSSPTATSNNGSEG